MTNSTLKVAPALLAILLATVVVSACGASGKSMGSTVGQATGAGSGEVSDEDHFKGDGDDDDYHVRDLENDGDDAAARAFGRPASAADVHAVRALVERYYATATAGNGAAGCALISSHLVRAPDFGEVAEAVFPPAVGAPLLRGKPCAEIMSLVFRGDHVQLVAERATLIVTGVRVEGSRGVALLAFRAMPERQLPVELEGRAWKLDALLQQGIR